MIGDGVNDAPGLKKADIGIVVADATDGGRTIWLTSVKAISPTLTSSATDSLLLHHENNESIDTQFSGQSSGHATGYVEEENSLGHGNSGLSFQRKDIRRDWEVPDDGKHVVHRTDESMPEFPSQILNSNGRSLETTDAYYRLLKVGRLMDCINVLGDLEKRDLLDMDKIYHASFFKLCKKQRAVKEAFRFTKLIPNPTLTHQYCYHDHHYY